MEVSQLIKSIENKERQQDCLKLLDFMKKTTGEDPKIWRSKLIGFGTYHYKYETGREGDWFLTGFSWAKQHTSIYIVAGVKNYPELMSKLGKYKTGASCIYVKKLADINLQTLEELVKTSIKDLKAKHE